jgi:hypothetical protein
MVERVVGVARRWDARLLLVWSLLVSGWLFPVAGSAATGPGFSALPGSLNIARYGAAGSPLPGGDVLIAGGATSDVTKPGATTLSSAEVFNPVTGVFTMLPGSMTTARFGAVAAPLPGGDVLIAGGTGSGLSSAELFHPATGVFTALPSPMTTPRWGAIAAPLPNGDILIAGGADNGTNILSSAELFDPTTGAFTPLPRPMTTPRFFAAAAPLPNGDVLIAGGNAGSLTSQQPLSSAELFDPATDAFTALPGSMTTARFAPEAAPLANGDVLIAGGSYAVPSSAEVFDPSTGVFTALPESMTTGRGAAIAAPLPGGDVLIAGGATSSGAVLSSAEVFDPGPQATITGGQFGDQPVGQPTPAQALVVTNIGVLTPLAITGASLSGVDPSDFKILADSCAGRSLALKQTCTITVRATPAASGARSAVLTLQDNEPTPATVTLTATGIAAVSRIHVITCKHITKHHKTNTTCNTKVVKVNAELAVHERATLTRHHVIYASGSTRHGQLILHSHRQVTAGQYTLTLEHLTGGRWITSRYQITIH